MPDGSVVEQGIVTLPERIDGCDVLRIDLTRAEHDGDVSAELIQHSLAVPAGATRLARINVGACGSALAALLADLVDGVEIAFAVASPEELVASVQAPDVTALRQRRAVLRGDLIGAVVVVSRTLLDHLAAMVEAAYAAGFARITFEPIFVAEIDDIGQSIFFDQAAFNAGMDRAIVAGKSCGIGVAGVKFGSQGLATSQPVNGCRRTVVVPLDKNACAPSLLPLQHMELATTHFAPAVIASDEFRARVHAKSAQLTAAARLAPLFRAHGLDPAFYTDIAHRLDIDLFPLAEDGTSQSIVVLNEEIGRRFHHMELEKSTNILIDLTKPFLGYNWGPAKSFYLPDQYQFRRDFNQSQMPVILLRLAPGSTYQLRTIIHDATPGDAIDFLQLKCNHYNPADQQICFEGRVCVHVCSIPAEVIDAARGYLQISYSITRKSADALATIGLRTLAVEPAGGPPARGSVKFRTMVARVSDGAVDRLAEAFGVIVEPQTADMARRASASVAADDLVQATGTALPGREGVIANFGLELADTCVAGAVDAAAERLLDLARKVEGNIVALMKPSPVEHRYTGIEIAVQFLQLVTRVMTLRCPADAVGMLLQRLPELAPTYRPGWLALAHWQLAAGNHDAAIQSARSAVHHDVCCITSQEMLRSAYQAKYPDASEPVIDGVAIYDLSDRFCSTPFDRIETAKDGIVWTCCPAWLGAPIGNMHRMRWEDAWNSDQAALVRQSILEGDFKYCNKGVCPVILANNLPRKSEVTDPHFRHYIDNKVVKLPEGPREVSLSHDPSCNLACPQCRNDFILADRAQNTEFSATIEPFIKPLIEYAHLDKSAILMSGDGEIFVSPHYREVLRLFDAEKHAGVTLNLLSNGLVFENGWTKVPNIHKLVKSITISTDAASEAAYRQIRGGSWEKLYRNIVFVSGLRRSRQIERFSINYAVQSGNYKDMRRMVEIGHDLGIDRIAFAILRNGGSYEAAEYAGRAIFEPAHPDHGDFIRELRDPIFRSSIVDISQFAGFLLDG
jgi:pyruvate-formate lyase-activating enzyme